MKRNANIDLLKTLAIIAVVMTHVNYQMLEFEIGSTSWMYGVILNTIVKYCVPIFIMCTGVIMLDDKEIPLKKIYTKYIPRFIVALLFWDSLYKIMNAYYEYKMGNLESMPILKNLEGLIYGDNKYHLYYMYIIILCYIFLPITKKIVKTLTESEYKYLLIVLFVTSVCLPYLRLFWPLNENKSILKYFAFNLTHLGIVYMIFGKYFYKKRDKFKKSHLIIAIILTLAIMVFEIIRRSDVKTYMGYWEIINPLLYIYVLAVFLLGLKINISEKFEGILRFLSKGSFFVYLSHLLVLDYVRYLGLSPLEMNGIMKFIYPLGLTLFLMVVCYLVYAVLSKIKILNNWIM